MLRGFEMAYADTVSLPSKVQLTLLLVRKQWWLQARDLLGSAHGWQKNPTLAEATAPEMKGICGI